MSEMKDKPDYGTIPLHAAERLLADEFGPAIPDEGEKIRELMQKVSIVPKNTGELVNMHEALKPLREDPEGAKRQVKEAFRGKIETMLTPLPPNTNESELDRVKRILDDSYQPVAIDESDIKEWATHHPAKLTEDANEDDFDELFKDADLTRRR